MTPDQALNILGLSHLIGQNLKGHEDEIEKAYRQLAMQHHPDRAGDEELFKDLNNAFSSLNSQEPQSPFAGAYADLLNRQRKQYKKFSIEEIRQFVQSVLDHGFRVVIYRYPYKGFEFFNRIGLSPYGKQSRKGRMPDDVTVDMMMEGLQRVIPSFPTSVIDATLANYPQRKEAWITWQSREDEFTSISFEPVSVKPKKQPGVGMKPADVAAYLISKGLRLVGGGNKNAYYGFGGLEGYMIRLKSKTIRLVNRSRIYGRALEDRGVTQEAYFGALTPQILDQMIAQLQRLIAKSQNNPSV